MVRQNQNMFEFFSNNVGQEIKYISVSTLSGRQISGVLAKFGRDFLGINTDPKKRSYTTYIPFSAIEFWNFVEDKNCSDKNSDNISG